MTTDIDISGSQYPFILLVIPCLVGPPTNLNGGRFRTVIVFLSLPFFCTDLRTPQNAPSGVVEFQYQNRDHRDNRLCNSNVFDVLCYIPCLQFLPSVPYRSVSSPSLSYSPSATASTFPPAPTSSITYCSHHLQATQGPGFRTVLSQRFKIFIFAIYCATVFCLVNM